MSDPILGEVDNGDRLAVQLGFYSGMAGVRARADGTVDVAFFASVPARMPSSGTIDGASYRLIGARKSDTVKGMIVVSARAA